MESITVVLLDLGIYVLQGWLLVMLLKEAQGRFPFKKRSVNQAILLLQYVAVQLFLHDSGMVKSIFYGNSMVMNSSRQSILPVLASMFVTCAVSMFLFKENRLKIAYYVVTFYSVLELLKFAFYSDLLWLFTKLVDLNQYLFLNRQLYGEQMFYIIASAIGMIWNLMFVLLLLLCAYQIIQWIKKYLNMKEDYQTSELLFLLFPSVIGLLLCMMIRSILFSVEGYETRSLFDSRPEMNLLIPCTSLLCIILIILAAKMLRKLIDESNQRIEISVYQDRIKEMEQHIGDIENLYAGIRGMKHDMKNYIADMEALMSEEAGRQSDQGAFRQYLGSLQASVEQLDMKYHTGHPVTDVILQRYVQLTGKYAVDFQADFLFPSNMNIDAFDLSIIINNALDNALEACRRQTEGKKYIALNAYRRENMFFIIIKNSFDGILAKDLENDRLRTIKPDAGNHGLGLRNIEVCAHKYYGKAETTVRDHEFELAVMLQKGAEEKA